MSSIRNTSNMAILFESLREMIDSQLNGGRLLESTRKSPTQILRPHILGAYGGVWNINRDVIASLLEPILSKRDAIVVVKPVVSPKPDKIRGSSRIELPVPFTSNPDRLEVTQALDGNVWGEMIKGSSQF